MERPINFEKWGGSGVEILAKGSYGGATAKVETFKIVTPRSGKLYVAYSTFANSANVSIGGKTVGPIWYWGDYYTRGWLIEQNVNAGTVVTLDYNNSSNGRNGYVYIIALG